MSSELKTHIISHTKVMQEYKGSHSHSYSFSGTSVVQKQGPSISSHIRFPLNLYLNINNVFSSNLWMSFIAKWTNIETNRSESKPLTLDLYFSQIHILFSPRLTLLAECRLLYILLWFVPGLGYIFINPSPFGYSGIKTADTIERQDSLRWRTIWIKNYGT